MSDKNKVHVPMYMKESTVKSIDALREQVAAELDVSNISRGDMVTRLVEKEIKNRNQP